MTTEGWGYAPPEPEHTPEKPKKKRRVFLWVFLAVQVLFLIWVVTGISSGVGADHASCEGLTGEDLQTCRDAGDVGTALGVGLIVFFWAAVDIILGGTYAIYRLVTRK